MDTDLWQLRVDLLMLADGRILKAARMEEYVRSGIPQDPKDGEVSAPPAEGGVVAFRARKPKAS